jgi:uncharacterized membrane protein YczE
MSVTLAVLSTDASKYTQWTVRALLVVLAAAQWRIAPVPSNELLRRVPRCVLGLVCFGVGISLFFAGNLGTGPWDVFHAGVAKVSGLPVGVVINLIGLAILPLWIPLKEKIGLGTVLNAVLIGMVVDLVKPRIGVSHQVGVRVLCVLAGVLIIGIGSGLYIGSGLGTGPRDGIMMGLSRMKLSVRTARTLVEAVTLVVGFLLGGKVGFGTVAFLCLIGPIVQVMIPRLSLPPLTPIVPTSSEASSQASS